MKLIDFALRRPIAVLAAVTAVALSALLALNRMRRDILPDLGVPVIYIAQPYGGMDPAQMEGYLTYYYEYHFLFVSGVEHMESKNIQGAALIKLEFHPGTDMAEAMSETVSYVDRARAYMPAGTLPPFVLRFDAGDAPIGDLVFTSQTRSLGELQDLALNTVRPMFATLPGVSAPPPFGASPRTIVIRVDPRKMRKYDLSPSEVAQAVSDANLVVPSGNIHVGKLYPMVPINSVVHDIQELQDVPLRTGTEKTVFLKEVGTIQDSSDIQTGYALVNGRRAVYMPVIKRAHASTMAVVDLIKKNLPQFQNALPSDVRISYEFDQSGYVQNAISSLIVESVAGALLSALVVVLFLGDWFSAVVVVIIIPAAILSALTCLWLSGETINIMTLGGLALAVGVLVDEATVTVENIDSHLALGEPLARAVLEAAKETFIPSLLALLSVLAVFVPSFLMVGITRALFVPLTLAVGFSMAASFILSFTFVPALAIWFLPHRDRIVGAIPHHSAFGNFQERYCAFLKGLFPKSGIILASYMALATLLILFLGFFIGREIFPQVDVGQFEMRLRAPSGTAIENTEALALKALDIIKKEAGPQNIESSIGYVGTQPSSFPSNLIYLWTSGPQEAVLEVALKRNSGIKVEALKERLRRTFAQEIPNVSVSFETSGIINRAMNGDFPTPIEVDIPGKNYEDDRLYAEKVKRALSLIPSLRDVQISQPFDYPAVHVDVDRRQAGHMGLTMANIGRAMVPATSSSRFIMRNYWAEPGSGITHQIQVEVPQEQMKSMEDVKDISITLGGGAIPLHRFAKITSTTTVGEYDRYNMQRMVTVTANIHNQDLGHAARLVLNALSSLKDSNSRGANVMVHGQIELMGEMLSGLGWGLCLAVIVIFLLLTANFESPILAAVILSTLPAVILGVEISLWLTGTTINVESFMGAIMAMGIAVANAILMIVFAEHHRIKGEKPIDAATSGARGRLRPILMTSIAMIAGMIPMALGIGEGGQQTAPLGRAVIGGLAAATIATLTLLPLAYSLVMRWKPRQASSLHPDDPGSAHHHKRQ